MHQINKSLWPNCTAVLFSKVDNWAPGLKLPWTLDTPFSRLHLHHLCYPYKDKSSFIIFGQTIIIYKWQWQRYDIDLSFLHQLYFFNTTNPEGFLRGEKAVLQEVRWISLWISPDFGMDFYFFTFGWISDSLSTYFGPCRLGRTSMRRSGTRWRWTGGTTRSPTGSESSTSISSKCWPRVIISKRG